MMNSDGVRVLCYGAASAACMLAWSSERQLAGKDDRGRWPALWVYTAALLAAFALIRLFDAQNLLTELGRSEARDSGLYEGRRSVQAAAVGLLSLAWLVTIIVAVWRVPERRRRYLPLIVVVVCIMAFAAVRGVSLHQLDQLLYHRELAGARFVVWGDLALTVSLTLVAMWRSVPFAARVLQST